MIDLAMHGAKGPVLLRDIARRQNISEKYLGHLVPLLKSAGLINATRGSKGGFVLVGFSSVITLKDIIEAVEGELSLAGETGGFWGEATNGIAQVLDSFTLKDIAEQEKAKEDGLSYSI